MNPAGAELHPRSCTYLNFADGVCGASNDGDSVNIQVEETYSDESTSPDLSDGGGGGWDDGEGGGGGGDAAGPSGPPSFTPSVRALASPMSSLLTPVQCRACGGGGGGARPTAPSPPRSFTVSDVLTLAPASVTLTAEPSTWSIVGSHTNFFTTATMHSAAGTVLGYPVTATFTPVSYRWDSGDGTTWETTTPGASWAALGQEDFTATATSHVYREKATVQASVTVVYAASVTLANGTSIPVTGTLDRASAAVPIELFTADTVITVGDCSEHPQQPRC
ncbi:hypothetical protein C5E10_07305 [Pseudoclavibacter sp. RFBG4]|nr:hypothetical protein C5E10_07305 [Pseudoclavibacter sp. RFBG4]